MNNAHSVSRDPAKGGLEKLIRQKEEYRKILLTTLSSFNCQKKTNTKKIINEKYARMEMQIAYSFKDQTLFEEKYKELKELKKFVLKITFFVVGFILLYLIHLQRSYVK